MFMAGQVSNRVVLQQGGTHAGQGFVLRFFEHPAVDAFELNANGVVVAVVASAVAGCTGMPGTLVATDKLAQVPIAADEKVRGHLHAFDAFEIRMRVPIQRIGEQALDLVTAKLPGWQADGVDHDKVNPRVYRAWTEIGRGYPACKLVPAITPQWGGVGWFRRVHQGPRCCGACRCSGARCGNGSGAGSSPAGLPRPCG